ncbi:EamA family transporter [Citrobacter koseri]|uniref:EamA family transporter n=1 Tax=Citrobacter koseri TaxID=545 RepID=UPI0021628070|nr:EamA family transporter [Citrobacter koseri]
MLTCNALPCLGAACLLLCFGMLTENINLATVAPRAMYAVAYLGIVAGVLGIMAYFQLQQRVLPFYASLVYFVFPLIAVALEDALTQHSLSPDSILMLVPFLCGIALVLSPLWYSSLSSGNTET